MDFPVCPACGQSVIDDDAVDCPFCGASMKAKPGSKPASAAAKPAAAAAKSAAGKPAPGKPTLPGDDFPFEAELTAGKSAIPAMPNPSKQRTLQVICPMCDTAGYVPPTAAGQDVRCANPKCVMPVFTVPAPKKVEEAPPPPPPPKSNNLLFVGIGTVVVVLAIGAGAYVVFTQPSSPTVAPKAKSELSEEDKQMMAEMMGGTKKPNPKMAPNSNPSANQTKKEAAKDPGTPAAESKIDAETLIKTALAQMNEACQQREKQRSKPYCRQLTAEANAVTGRLQQAQEDLDQLLKVGAEVTYYRVMPLLELFWVDFATGNKKSSAERLNLAVTELPKIPKFGRTRLEITGRLAAAMVAAGQTAEALKLLNDFHADDSDAQLAARLQIASDGRVAQLSNSFSVLPWKHPQAVAATASLITRGQHDAAAKWASAQTNEDAKAECLAYWAENYAYHKAESGTADADGKIEAAVNSLPPVLAARVWARAGCGRWQAKDQAGFAAAIKLAQGKLAEVAAPAEIKMPAFKLTESFNLPDADPLLQAATAACEITYLQAQSAATRSDAEKSLDVAMSYVDAMSPTFAAAREQQLAMQKLGIKGLRDKIKTELKKRTDDEASRAANNFKRKIDEIVKASEQRFDLETLILSRLRGAGVGLDTKVWIIVNARTMADDVEYRDNFMATSLPGELVEGLKGNVEAQAILAAWQAQFKGDAPPRPPAMVFNELLQKDVAAAVDFVQTVDTKFNLREEILLQASSRLPAENKLSIAFQFIGRLDDIVIREDCYLLSAAQGARKGQADLVSKQVGLVVFPTEKVAICRGLIAGLQASDRQKNDGSAVAIDH